MPILAEIGAVETRRLDCVLGDHAFFVRLDDEHRDGGIRRADDLLARLVGVAIEISADPADVGQNRRANFRRVLANAAGEHDGVEAADGRGEAANLPADAGHEIGDGVARRVAIGGLQFAHVVRNARQPLNPESL